MPTDGAWQVDWPSIRSAVLEGELSRRPPCIQKDRRTRARRSFLCRQSRHYAVVSTGIGRHEKALSRREEFHSHVNGTTSGPARLTGQAKKRPCRTSGKPQNAAELLFAGHIGCTTPHMSYARRQPSRKGIN